MADNSIISESAASDSTSLRRTYLKPLFIVMGMVAVVLIACARIANMLLARATAPARSASRWAAAGRGWCDNC